MWKLFQSYKKWTKDNPITIEDYVGKDAIRVMREKPRCLTMEGFENYVANLSPEQAQLDNVPLELDQYFSNQDELYNEYMAICSHIRREIRQDQIEGGMAGVYNPSITQRLNGLVDRKDVKSGDKPLQPAQVVMPDGKDIDEYLDKHEL